jgi:SAM-dependent methyltransferase
MAAPVAPGVAVGEDGVAEGVFVAPHAAAMTRLVSRTSRRAQTPFVRIALPSLRRPDDQNTRSIRTGRAPVRVAVDDVAVSFDVAAESYDRFIGDWSRKLAPLLADLAGVERGQRVLDVGCGPGSLMRELVARVGAANVAGIDPSESFVAAARARNPGADVRQGAAEDLPFADGSFDAALAQLVVHFMSDPVAGLREMARVTRPGGVVAACVWDYGGDRGPLGPYWPAAREIDPDVDDESRRAGARRGHLAELFAEAGLTDVRDDDLEVSRDYPGFDEWWVTFTRGVGPAGGFYASLDDAGRARLEARCRELLPSGAFTLTAHAWAARGTVA